MSRRHKIDCTSGPRGLTPIRLSSQGENETSRFVPVQDIVGQESDIARVCKHRVIKKGDDDYLSRSFSFPVLPSSDFRGFKIRRCRYVYL
jgi:hypothetical protein